MSLIKLYKLTYLKNQTFCAIWCSSGLSRQDFAYE